MSDGDARFRCTKCGWRGDEYELVSKMVAPRTQETPAEWEEFCPDCSASMEDLVELDRDEEDYYE